MTTQFHHLPEQNCHEDYSGEIQSYSQLTCKQHQLGLLMAYLQMHDYQFTTVSPLSHKIVNARPENAFTENLTGIFGWNRTFTQADIDADLFSLMQSSDILMKVESGWKSKLRVSSICVPSISKHHQLIFLHSGFPTNDGDSVFFGPDTYRFANVIHQFLSTQQYSVKRAVDIGTGSGAGVALLATALPESEIIGVDINEVALDLAKINTAAAGLHNIKCMHSDLLNNVEGNFDLIIANPPYLLDESERAYRHGGGQLGDGLSISIVNTAIERLNAGGTLLLYTGVAIVNGIDAFLAEISIRLDFAGFTYTYAEIDPDIFGDELQTQAYSQVDRISAVVLTAQKPAN